MLVTAKPDSLTPLKLADLSGDYGADLLTDPANTAAVWLAETREDALACLRGPDPTTGLYPGVRLPPGTNDPVPGRDDTGSGKRLWVVSESGSQWVSAAIY
jgi:hypothetical protein